MDTGTRLALVGAASQLLQAVCTLLQIESGDTQAVLDPIIAAEIGQAKALLDIVAGAGPTPPASPTRRPAPAPR